MFVGRAEAQLPSAFDRGAVGVSGGSMLFYGDLTDYNILPDLNRFPNSFKRGYRAFLKKKLIGGLGARVGFEKGGLQGEHRNGEGAQLLRFETDVTNVNLSANYELTRIFTDKKKVGERRYYADLNVGIGLLFFRSYSYRSELGGYKNYYGYTEADVDKGGNKKILLGRDDQVMKLSVPVGVDFGYRLNKSLDVTANVSLFNTTTDKLDSFVRDWTARDKFAYFGVGLTYNFNRSEDQYPEKEEEEEDEEEGGSASSSDQEDEVPDVSDIDVSEASADKKGLLQDIFDGDGDKSKEDLLRIKMKLFQIQMKLFQMQYLLKQQE